MLVSVLAKEWGCAFPRTGGKIVYCVIADPGITALWTGSHRVTPRVTDQGT